MSLAVAPGEMVTLMGRNGMGKTTTVRSIMGLTPAMAGSIRFAARRSAPPLLPGGAARHRPGAGRAAGLSQSHRARKSGCHRRQPRRAADPWTLDKVCALFPRLAQRIDSMGNLLSGGEQQMLAIGRALMTNPRLLILDEATEGLAPLIRAEIWRCLGRLKAQGLAVLVIDKNVEALTRLADRHYLIERGRVVWTGTSPQLAAAPDVQHRIWGFECWGKQTHGSAVFRTQVPNTYGCLTHRGPLRGGNQRLQQPARAQHHHHAPDEHHQHLGRHMLGRRRRERGGQHAARRQAGDDRPGGIRRRWWKRKVAEMVSVTKNSARLTEPMA